jgi:hypothetical protein
MFPLMETSIQRFSLIFLLVIFRRPSTGRGFIGLDLLPWREKWPTAPQVNPKFKKMAIFCGNGRLCAFINCRQWSR